MSHTRTGAVATTTRVGTTASPDTDRVERSGDERSGPCEDCLTVRAGREGAEGAAGVAGEPRRAERVGYRGRGVAHEQRGLQQQRHPLDHAPAAGLDAVEVVQLRLETPSRLVEAVVRIPCEPDLVEERLERRGLAPDGAQHVEADDVARSLPDAVARALAEEPRHGRVLDIPVAAEALERFGRVRRLALAHPVLDHGGGKALERGFALVAGGGRVVGGGEQG